MKQDSFFYHRLAHRGTWEVTSFTATRDELRRGDACSAFTIAELGEMLPAEVEREGRKYRPEFGKGTDGRYRFDYWNYH